MHFEEAIPSLSQIGKRYARQSAKIQKGCNHVSASDGLYHLQ